MRLPNILIIGGQKCGTSTLHATLVNHPDVRPPIDPCSGQSIKEVDFFINQWDKGLDWYCSHFRNQDGSAIDSTPNYLCDRAAHWRMARHVPTAKLVISLRDPVARAMSQYNHYRQMLDQTRSWDWIEPDESFEFNVTAEMQQPLPPWYGLLGRGCYLEQLEHLLGYFSRGQIHVMVMEHWAANPEIAMVELLEFLELPQVDLSMQIRHVRSYNDVHYSDSLIQRLQKFYRPHNDRLFKFLGERIALWDARD